MHGTTDFLFAEPSFLNGMASVLDIGGTQFTFNEVRTGKLADHIAFMMDWRAVGDDMRRAMKQVADEAGVEVPRFNAAAR